MGLSASLDGLPESVRRPQYDRSRCGIGIVHIGVGAFHRAHQAVYTDDALNDSSGDWRILGVSLRSRDTAERLNAQDGLFSVTSRGVEGSETRVIGSLARAHDLGSGRAAIEDALTAASTRIVSLTITEKGYGIDRVSGGIDQTHPAIAHDLEQPQQPQSAAGLLLLALTKRRERGLSPFAVLCCDNLPRNGAMLRELLADLAAHIAPEMEAHIREEVSFPSTMVDRITPAPTPETKEKAAAALGCRDEAAVECESFRQWVIENAFPLGRPRWEVGGAIFTGDVRPYETMKLRMLNGAHSMLSYAGFLAGCDHVRDVMADAELSALVARHLAAAAATLAPLPGMDYNGYAESLAARFANPHIAHETSQIAMDGSEKLPQRIFAPAVEARKVGGSAEAFAFAVAAWMRYLLERKDDGSRYALSDPRAETLRAAVSGADTAEDITARLLSLSWLCPQALAADAAWAAAVSRRLETMLEKGMGAAIAQEAREAREFSRG